MARLTDAFTTARRHSNTSVVSQANGWGLGKERGGSAVGQPTSLIYALSEAWLVPVFLIFLRKTISGNSKKCHILSISRQRNKSSPIYYLGTDLLSTVSSHTYLGITVSSDLKWHERNF